MLPDYEDETVQQLYPGLVDAAFLIGGIQIQGRATIGGNLCNSSPSATPSRPSLPWKPSATLQAPMAAAASPVEEFCTGPGRNQLQEGELLVSLNFPSPQANSGAAFLRFIPRNEMDIAIANSGVSVVLDDAKEKVVSARIAVGAVAPTPVMASAAADSMAGKEANEATIEEAAEAAKAVANPINDMRGTIPAARPPGGGVDQASPYGQPYQEPGRSSRHGR